MDLTNENYFSPNAEALYFSASQCKSFMRCEAAAVAELQGSYIRPESKALLMGSYVDAYFTGDFGKFVDDHPEIFTTKGNLRSEYRLCEDCIERVEKDPFFMKYLEGDKQKVLTGEIFGHKFKCKIDILHKTRIVDLKLMKDMAPIWKAGTRQTFVDAWNYDLQGFIYQQLVEQNTGEHLPFYLAVITKESVPDYEIIHIPDWKLNSSGEVLKHYIDRWASLKRGDEPPFRCGSCDYCRKTKRLKEPLEYEELFEEVYQ